MPRVKPTDLESKRRIVRSYIARVHAVESQRFYVEGVKMVTLQVPNFCTIAQVCQELGFTYYTVSYWLDHNLVKWIPAGKKKLINMENLNQFLNGNLVDQDKPAGMAEEGRQAK